MCTVMYTYTHMLATVVIITLFVTSYRDTFGRYMRVVLHAMHLYLISPDLPFGTVDISGSNR